MDLQHYQKEVSKLQKDVESFDTDLVDKPKERIVKYKYYILIVISTFLFLIIIKPKVILKVSMTAKRPEIIIDKAKFVIWWIISSIIGLGLYYMTKKLKKYK
jgi:hypothetical protein